MATGIAKKALTIQSGIPQRIADADTLRVGNGIDVSSGVLTITAGAASSISLASDVSLASAKSITAVGGASALDFSASSGLFKTGTGAVTINGNTTLAANVNFLCAAGTTLLDLSLGTGIFSTTTGAVSINGTATLAANKNFLAAAGTTAFDFSLGTGIFSTTTGAVSINGTTTLAASKNFIAAGGTTIFDFSAASGVFRTSSGVTELTGDVFYKAGSDTTVEAGASSFDFSGGTGLFKTSTGAVTIGTGAVTVSGVTTFTAAGTALTVNNNAVISGTLLVTGQLNANSNIRRSTSGTAGVFDDNNTTSIVFGGGAAQTTVTIGKAGQNTTILGNLVVSGTTTSVDSETVLLADNHMYLNHGYETVSAQTGGLVVNYLPMSTNDTVAAGGFTAGVAAVSNPTAATAGAATFAVGQFIQITGATLAANNGLFEVLSHAANVLTIRGVGTTAAVEDFTQNQFTASAGAVGTIRRVNVAIMRAGTDGVWEVGSGAVTGVTFTDLAAGSSTLQSAYVAGNTITTSGGEGNVTIGGTEDLVVADSVDLAFTSTGGFSWTAATGAFNLQTTGAVTIRGGGVSIYGDDTAAFSFNGTGTFTTPGLVAGSITPSGALTFTAGAASTWSTSAGALTLTSAAAATWSTAAGALTVNGTAGLLLQAAAATLINLATAGSVTITPASTQNAVITVSGGGATNISGGVTNINASSNFATNINTGTSTGAFSVGNPSAGAVSFSSGGTFTANCVGAATLFTSAAASVTIGHNNANITLNGLVGSISIPVGTLTMSSGSTFTAGSTGGTVTLNAGGGTMNLQTSGSTRIEITDTTGLVQSGVTFGVAVGGMIDLPLNFEINGSAVGNSVTAANLTTVTDGSNADALHTHTNVGAAQTIVAATANVALTAGDLVAIIDDGGSPEAALSDADGAGTLVNSVGFVKTAASANAAVNLVVAGEIPVPDANWDSVPGTGDVGKKVYASLTPGNVTLTAPSAAGETIQKVAIVSIGGTGAVRVIVQIGDGVLLV